jgi:hypothetical protein
VITCPLDQCQTPPAAGEFFCYSIYDAIIEKRRFTMDKKFGAYVFGGMLIGALFGMLWAGSGNPILGIGIGALAGTFIGWFGAAYVREKEKKN